jgi:Ca2+-binding RTX toxin-like protein
VTVGAAGTADITSWNASEVEINSYGTGSFMMTVTATDASGGKSWEYMSVVTAADMFTGTAAANTLTGNGNANVLSGGDGNDTLSGGGGADMLYGGKGNDSLTGGTGADVFAWRAADKGTPGSAFTDTVTDFDKTNGTGDKLDLRDLLVGENAGNIDRFIVAEVSGGNTILHISSTGAFAGNGTWTAGAQDQVITLNSVTWTGTSQDILQQMLNGGQLVIG